MGSRRERSIAVEYGSWCRIMEGSVLELPSACAQGQTGRGSTYAWCPRPRVLPRVVVDAVLPRAAPTGFPPRGPPRE
jgi:hypothetical protein